MAELFVSQAKLSWRTTLGITQSTVKTTSTERSPLFIQHLFLQVVILHLMEHDGRLLSWSVSHTRTLLMNINNKWNITAPILICCRACLKQPERWHIHRWLIGQVCWIDLWDTSTTDHLGYRPLAHSNNLPIKWHILFTSTLWRYFIILWPVTESH